MLEIKNIYKTFNAGTVNEKRALKGVNLTLEDGDFVTVIGGNGAGIIPPTSFYEWHRLCLLTSGYPRRSVLPQEKYSQLLMPFSQSV